MANKVLRSILLLMSDGTYREIEEWSDRLVYCSPQRFLYKERNIVFCSVDSIIRYIVKNEMAVVDQVEVDNK